MTLQEKETLFSNFLVKWEKPFNKIPFILNYISTYQEINDKLDDFQSISIDELENSQLEWISLVAQFDNSIETTFFKDYWVPIQNNGYDYFIDLSSESLPLFETQYFFFEPYRWYKKYIFKDLSQFLINLDNPKFNIENHFKQFDNERWSKVTDFFKERDELGFAGLLELDPIKKDSIFCKKKNSDFIFEDNCITFSGINSIIIGLLPNDCSITLKKFSAPFNRNNSVCDKVKNIKGLIYLLQSVGLKSIDSFSISFDPNEECKAEFKDNMLKIIHTNKELLKNLISKYEYYKSI